MHFLVCGFKPQIYSVLIHSSKLTSKEMTEIKSFSSTNFLEAF